MIIKNVKLYTPDGGWQAGFLETNRDIIKEIDADTFTGDATDVFDGEGLYLIPGFIDMHFHGCMGADVCDADIDALRTIAEYELSVGVTSIAPATMTLREDMLIDALKTLHKFSELQKTSPQGAQLVGINMEGPFISREKCGAQDPQFIKPFDAELMSRFIDASGGLVKFIGVAPEREGALDFIDAVKDRVTVTLAHTDAAYDDAKAAIDHGARHIVHLYNAMRPFLSREPGVVGAAAECAEVTAELICDGVHIHPSTVRATFEMFGSERLILISDSMRATGLNDGTYTLGGQDVTVRGNVARLVSDGTIAGSVTNLPECVRIAVRAMNIRREDAIRAATRNPAVRLGIYDSVGSIEAGKKADLLLVDDELNVLKVMKHGKWS